MQRRQTRPSGRDADPRRTIPLNSSAWQKLRAYVLAVEPLCRECKALATDVDHVSGDPSDNRPQNLQPLCHACHSRKTMHERNSNTSACDASGLPTDARHPWNVGRETKKSLEGDRARPPPGPFLNR